MNLSDKEKRVAQLVIRLIDDVECPMLMFEEEKSIVKKSLLNALQKQEIGWILACEKLPEENPTIFVSGDERTSDYVFVTVNGMTFPKRGKRVLIARYSYTLNRWVIPNSNYGEVTAWMELPKPYEVEK